MSEPPQGMVINADQNSLKAVAPGPTRLEDFALHHKISHFDHKRIPERVVHARGYGAQGTFAWTTPMSDVTRAVPFADKGKVTPVFVRFSTVAGSKGSPATSGALLSSSTAIRQLGSGGQQCPGLFHSGCNQVSRPDPYRQTRHKPRLSTGHLAARQLLEFHLADPPRHSTRSLARCPTAPYRDLSPR